MIASSMNKKTKKPPTFASLLSAWRKKHDISQPTAARTLNVPLATFRGWEQGKHLPCNFVKLAVLGMMKNTPTK